MWGGKTEALVSRLVRAKLQDIPVLAFNPGRNQRYGTTDIKAHSGAHFPAIAVETGEEILQICKERDPAVVGIDEFFMIPDAIVAVRALLDRRAKVVVATLDMDSEAKVWSSVTELMGVAEEIVKCPAVCASCKGDAYYTFRKGMAPSPRVLVGADDFYEPRCRTCFEAGQEAKRFQDGEEGLFSRQARR